MESRRDEPIKTASDRSFGFVMAGFFAIVGLWPLLFLATPRWWSLVISAGFAGAAAVKPAMLAPANRLWMRFGMLLHKIVNPVVMGFVFFSTVVPIGIVMRMMGKDLLRLRIDRSAPTYWIARTPPGPAPESMKNQF